MKEIQIGTQIWMEENLNLEKFRNGESIPKITTEKEWKEAGFHKKPAWCYYNFDPMHGPVYGKLYNWWAVNDSRGLTPEGWHIPSYEEWKVVSTFLGPEAVGWKMKGSELWDENPNPFLIKCDNCYFWSLIQRIFNPCEKCKNSRRIYPVKSGFSALPGGKWCHLDGFCQRKYSGYWWSSTGMETIFGGLYGGCVFVLSAHDNNFYLGDNVATQGYSVRCLKD